MNVCQACSRGRYGNKPGAVAPEACTLCPAGRVGTEEGVASSNCSRECGPGYVAKAGEWACQMCGKSEFSTGGVEACTNCGKDETTVTSDSDKGASHCVCQSGFFANPSAVTISAPHGCTKCPAGFECDVAGVDLASVNMKHGFWRSDNSSTRALPCPSKDSCNGSSSAAGGAGGCALGHEGPFCSLCSQSYTRFSGTGSCQPCPSKEDELSATAVLVAIIAGFFVAAVLYALFNHKVPKGLLKPFINGMQYLAIAMTSSTAKRPKIVEDLLKALSVLSFDFNIMSLSCMVRYV